jgi:hypothetical protein
LIAGQTYRFSYMVSGGSGVAANIGLFVDGAQKGTLTQVGAAAGWQKVVVGFVAQNNGETLVGLKDTNTNDSGNNFLIDKLNLMNLKGIEADLSQLNNNAVTVKKYGDSNSTDTLFNIEDLVGTSVDDKLTGNALKNALTGGAGNDYLNGKEGDDILQGSNGNDTLFGEDGNDTLWGGAGADTVMGGAGNDIFAQTVELQVADTMDGGTGTDTVNYGLCMLTGRYVMVHRNGASSTNVSTSSFKVRSEGKDVVATKQVASDKSWEQLDLGKVMTIDEISASFSSLPGAYSVYVCDEDMRQLTPRQIEARNDVTISVQSGNSLSLMMQAGGIVANMSAGKISKKFSGFITADDNIVRIENVVGTAYSDILIGDDQANNLKGGAGNDTLSGGAGNDVFWFGLGSGEDTFSDYDTTLNNFDILCFEEGITSNRLWFTQVGENLRISVIGTNDCAVVNQWNKNQNTRIEAFKTSNLSDNKFLDVFKVNSLIQVMSAFNDIPVSVAAFADARYNGVRNAISNAWT